MFVDSHCHLDDSAFDADREEVIARARAVGVRYLLTIGGPSYQPVQGGAAGPDQMDSALTIATRGDGIYAAAGVHPHEASKAEEKHFEQLKQWAGHAKFLAIGEIGLDYHYDHSPRDVQKAVFIHQLELARETKLPIVIHCREAWSDLGEIIAAHWKASGLGGILHCFSGEREDAARFLDWGFMVSFAGNITFKKADELRAVAKQIPPDRLLTETDSPYLAPVPHRGKRNEPAYVAETTRALAAVRGVSPEALGEQASQNFERLFQLVNGV